MLFSVLTRKSKVPRHDFDPPRSQPWLRGGRALLAAPSGQVPTSCPAVIPEGAMHHPSWPSASSGHPDRGDQVCDLDCDPDSLCCWVAETGLPQRFTTTTRPGPRLVEGLRKDPGALEDTVPSLFPGPSSSPTGPRLGKQEGLQDKAWIYLSLPSLPDDPRTTDPWLDYFPSGSVIPSGKGPLHHCPVAEQDK